MHTTLAPAAVLRIEGDDAVAFAQSQFTSDVAALTTCGWQWSAWLDATGRVRHFFALLHVKPSELLVWQPLGNAAAMGAALQRFVMRAKVRLDVPDGWWLHAIRSDELGGELLPQQLAEHACGYALALPGPEARIAWLARPAQTVTDAAALDAWRMLDIRARLPLLGEELAGEFVPQALDLEGADAIRFDKGCYPGQEVAARLHFRGGNKRHLRELRIEGVAPASGATLRDDAGTDVGRILYCAADVGGTRALGVVSDAAAAGGGLSVDGASAASIVD